MTIAAAIIRVSAGLCGAAVVAAATHANILAAGGWHTADAPIIVTVAALLAVGMALAGILWQSGSRTVAIVFVTCLLAGEGYWLGTNAERELRSREAAAAPHAAALRLQAEAQMRVAEAAAALAALPAASPRLAAALHAKADADAAVTAKSAERGCAENCRLLLNRQVDAAAIEITATRAADSARQMQLDRSLAEARAHLATMPALVAHAPLAAHLGISQVAFDLAMAAMRSLAIIGGSIAVAVAIHPRHAPHAPLPARSPQLPAEPREREPEAQLPPSRETHQAPIRLPPPLTPRQHAAKFAYEVMEPDASAVIAPRDILAAYRSWTLRVGIERLPDDILADELAGLLKAAGRTVRDGKLLGITLRA